MVLQYNSFLVIKESVEPVAFKILNVKLCSAL